MGVYWGSWLSRPLARGYFDLPCRAPPKNLSLMSTWFVTRGQGLKINMNFFTVFRDRTSILYLPSAVFFYFFQRFRDRWSHRSEIGLRSSGYIVRSQIF